MQQQPTVLDLSGLVNQSFEEIKDIWHWNLDNVMCPSLYDNN